MTYEEKVEFLRSFKDLRNNLIAYNQEIKELEESMLPKGLHISDMPKRGGSDDPMGDFGAEFWRIDQKIVRTQRKMIRIVATINQLEKEEPVCHRLLVERYIKMRTMKEQERVLDMSRNTVRKYHRIAIERLKI